eukprot:scaffold141526_cov102-Phaeocystis_antarctica.AAC.1
MTDATSLCWQFWGGFSARDVHGGNWGNRRAPLSRPALFCAARVSRVPTCLLATPDVWWGSSPCSSNHGARASVRLCAPLFGPRHPRPRPQLLCASPRVSEPLGRVGLRQPSRACLSPSQHANSLPARSNRACLP